MFSARHGSCYTAFWTFYYYCCWGRGEGTLALLSFGVLVVDTDTDKKLPEIHPTQQAR